MDLTWQQAKDITGGRQPTDWNDEQKERQAQEWATCIYRAFGGKFATAPDIAARAIQIYSSDLPRQLLSTDAFEDQVTELHACQELERRMDAGEDVLNRLY